MTPRRRDFGLLVVGSGPAGVHAAVAYLEAGGDGPVGLVSADVDAPYQRPPLSKDVLAGAGPPERTPILEDESALAGVEVRLATRVTGLDTERRVLETEDGEELGYARLVVATGSTPAPLPGVDDRAPVFLLRDLEQARALVAAAESAHTAVVVGSGFIGCEAAASLATRGVRTTLVTPEPAPQAARLGEWVGGRVAEWLRGLGVRLLTGVQVEAVGPDGTVVLDDGSSVEADLVLAAVGVSQARPFLEGSALLTSDDGHLVVDDTLRTSDPHVWAAGDVAEARHAVVQRPIRVEHWGDAVAMGELAGHNAAGRGGDGPRRWSDPPGFWSQVGERTLKYSAWGDGYAQERVVDHGGGGFTVWYADGAGELVGVLTHDADDDYERGAALLSRRAGLTEAVDASGSACMTRHRRG